MSTEAAHQAGELQEFQASLNQGRHLKVRHPLRLGARMCEILSPSFGPTPGAREAGGMKAVAVLCTVHIPVREQQPLCLMRVPQKGHPLVHGWDTQQG